MSKKEIMILIILAGVNFTNIMDFMIMMPLQEYLAPEFHISPAQFSWLVSAYGFSAGIASLTASFIVDRFDRKRVLLFAFAGLIAGTFMCAAATSYAMLMTARIVAGMFGGLIGAQVLSIVGDLFSFERRGMATGILMSAFSMAAVIGVPTGLFLAGKYGWHFPFLGIGFFGLLAFLLALFTLPSVRNHLQNRSNSTNGMFDIYKEIMVNRNQQLGLLMMFTLILAHFSIIPFIAPYLEVNVKFTKDQIALMYFVGGIASLVSSPVIGKLSDKYGKQKVLKTFLFLSAIPVFLITNMPQIPYYYVITITALFFLVAGGRMVPAQALITSVVKPQQRGGFMNINSSLMQIATATAAFVAGMIVTKNADNQLVNYNIVGYLGIAVSLLCIYIVGKVKAGE